MAKEFPSALPPKITPLKNGEGVPSPVLGAHETVAVGVTRLNSNVLEKLYTGVVASWAVFACPALNR